MNHTMNHVKYYQLVKVKGLLAAYQQYQADGGVLGPKAFSVKYNR